MCEVIEPLVRLTKHVGVLTSKPDDAVPASGARMEADGTVRRLCTGLVACGEATGLPHRA